MTSKQELTGIVQEQVEQQFAESQQSLVNREALSTLEAHLKTPHAVILTGIRRGGKSTACKLIRQKYFTTNSHQFNFEDERLVDFSVKDFSKLHEVLIEFYGDHKTFFLDEIQNIEKWELFVRRLMDQGYKFFITGSNAAMLSQELGTRLTGRNTTLELYPFSFREFLVFRNFKNDVNTQHTTVSKAGLNKLLNEYLLGGGMPEYLQYNDSQLLANTYDDILYRDIITRYQIRDVAAFKRLAIYLFNNYSAKITYSSLKPILNIKNTSTISNYFYYLENSYLIFTLCQFSFSLKQQHLLPKKIYVIDSGIANVLNIQSSRNLGRLLENLVFIELKRHYKEIYYFESAKKLEVDFIVMNRGKPQQLIQVSLDISNEKTRAREIKALKAAMEETGLNQSTIITLEEEGELKEGTSQINIVPISRWLLEVFVSDNDRSL